MVLENLDPMDLSQAEIAAILAVDRTTVRAYTKQGMPYRKPEVRGGRASFCGPVAINWKLGHRVAESRGLQLSPVEKIAVGWLLGVGEPNAEELKLFVELLGYLKIPPRKAEGILEFARGVLV